MRALIAIVILVIVGVGVYYVIEDANEGALEDAAEEVDDAADEVDDELD